MTPFDMPPTRRVLIVDHDRTTLEMAEIRLEVAGYDAVAVRDAVAALKVLEAGDVDAVVLERQLPAMASLQILEALASTVPVLLTGRKLTDEHIEAAAAHGVCAGLAKPYSGAALLERVDRMLAEGAPACAAEPEDAWLEV
ncbi:MAG: response regulator [Pseudomonadota bacterium]